MAKKKKSNKVLYILLGLVVILVVFAIVGKSAGWIGKAKEIEVELADAKKRTNYRDCECIGDDPTRL